jgi:hypothetical protein
VLREQRPFYTESGQKMDYRGKKRRDRGPRLFQRRLAKNVQAAQKLAGVDEQNQDKRNETLPRSWKRDLGREAAENYNAGSWL